MSVVEHQAGLRRVVRAELGRPVQGSKGDPP